MRSSIRSAVGRLTMSPHLQSGPPERYRRPDASGPFSSSRESLFVFSLHRSAAALQSIRCSRNDSCNRINSFFRKSHPDKQDRRLSNGGVKFSAFWPRKEVEASATDKISNQRVPVYLYIPNIIGFIRILMTCFAFAHCFSNKRLFAVLYFLSFACDGLDGWFARKFNQASTFGAVLDMVTDRVSTVCLLALLSHFYRPQVLFFSLLALDISSHWLQMYSTFLVGKASHKDVKSSSNWLLKAYYGNQLFMAYCCVGTEVLYIFLFLIAENHSEHLIDILVKFVKQRSILSFPITLALSGCAVKQAVNIIQMKIASDVCVHYDKSRRE